ncbi:branched-chain amino acid ABC transporter permease [Subtercola frigoramans]|uniref:Branched-chain amino acid transport system permease protein n=1 Tax=Subtercola frigoramans TaxID=120298 RepID=A0ABS2L978_9MICO|nr:branched-chain amino acid ABC transporter permease [Subtercola frigoramans]MBM7473651.1 branched-chain amino acid transport system permease protein [Subtercola frigoramans]
MLVKDASTVTATPSSRRARLRERSTSTIAIVIVGVLAYLAVTLLRGDQGLVAVLVVAWAISLTGLNIVQGLGGYPSIAQGAFFGIGAYVSSILFNAGWSFISAAVVALVATTGVGFLVAVVFSRTRGQYFSIGTLFFGAVTALVFSNEAQVTGGPNGLPVGLGLPLRTLLITMVVSLVAALLIFDAISRSAVGNRLRSVRSDEDLAEHLGVPTARTKAIAVILSAFFGAWGGILLAQYNGVVAPSQFTFMQGFLMFVAIGVGGYGRLFTPIVGAVIVVGFSQLLHLQPGVSQIVLGVVFILITLLMPGGIIGSLELVMRRVHSRKLVTK